MVNFLSALHKTRFGIKSKLHSIFSSEETITEKDFSTLKNILISADVGTECTKLIISQLKYNCHKSGIVKKSELKKQLISVTTEWLKPFEVKWQANKINQFETILVFGINGAGKTSSLAKIANKLKQQNKKVVMVAGDTYRAAAVEQLTVWAERLNIPIIGKENDKNPATLTFDAIDKSKQSDTNIILVDTSGRLHNNNNLMQELEKIIRVSKKADENSPHYRWLVLDATLGLNSINQAKVFNDHLDVNGIIITKLDSSAKAGAIFAIVKAINAPIVFTCTGESLEDITEFNAQEFVKGMLDFSD